MKNIYLCCAEGGAVYEAEYEDEDERRQKKQNVISGNDLESEASLQAKRSSSHELVAAADALVGLHLRSGEQHVFEPHKYASLAAKVCTGCGRQEVIFSIISRSPCVCVCVCSLSYTFAKTFVIVAVVVFS